MKKILVTFVAVFACLSVAYAQKAQAIVHDTQARLLDVTANAYVKPLTVEVQVISNTRVVDTWELTVEQVRSMNGLTSNIRSWGVFQSSRKHNCDLLVAATFDFKNDPDNPESYQLTVMGFPANFVNWKTAEDKDYEWIRMEKFRTTSELDKIQAVVK